MYTLGINAVYHDPAACLVKDGQVVAAAEEERFTHIKHGKRAIPFSTYELPFNAINYCLQEADIKLVDVDHIAYSYDPFLLPGKYSADATITLPLEPGAHASEWESVWDPLFLASIVNAPRHLVGDVPLRLLLPPSPSLAAGVRSSMALCRLAPFASWPTRFPADRAATIPARSATSAWTA